MKHKEGPLQCGCYLAEASPPVGIGGGMVMRDWQVIRPCQPHTAVAPVVFSFCMTCEKIFDMKNASKETDRRLSHGYCPPCSEAVLKSL